MEGMVAERPQRVLFEAPFAFRVGPADFYKDDLLRAELPLAPEVP